MRSVYKYDVFISFAHEDTEEVRPIYKKMTEHGLTVFWAERKLEPGVEFPPQLENALMGSQHFALYCSKKATESEWVRKECQIFLNSYHMSDKTNRRMFVLPDKTCDEEDIPVLLKDLHRSATPDGLVKEVVKVALEGFKTGLGQTANRLEQQEQKVKEAQNYYRYNRFWGPIAENGDVYIFTCGRDVPHNPESQRGYGGRTNIDMWDYRAVLDITHFFASKYPNTKITIEDPMSKLHGQDLAHVAHLADRISHMRSMLENKECIIVGSPDVSDFAELVLAHIHQIDPYTDSRDKKKGFVIIKEQKYTTSSFYWQTLAQEQEGVAQILGQDEYEYFPNDPVREIGGPGKMYGILVVVNNPFCDEGLQRKIVILSGFSGVATNAIAKILTDEDYLKEFFKLDNAYVNLDRDIEALIGVEFVADTNFIDRDTRRIKTVTFERLVEV